MSPKLQVYVALLLCVGATAVVAATCDPANSALKCFSCGAMSACNATGFVVEGKPCLPGQACMEDYGTAFCASVDRTKCGVCTSGSIFCDPYNAERVLVCVAGKAPLLTKTCAQGEVCRSGTCVKGSGSTTGSVSSCSNVTGSTAVYKVDTPYCRTGVLCFNATVQLSVGPCAQNQYFNPNTGLCANLPVNSCEGKGDGLFPHMTDCTKRVVCQGGTRVMDIPCEQDELVINNLCEASKNTSGCPALTGCTFESDGSINPKPPVNPTQPQTPACTSSNVNERYPHETKCKKYYTCRLTKGQYVMIESTCIGVLVFNPVRKFCDVASPGSSCVERNARLALENRHRAHQHQASDIGSLSSYRKFLLRALNQQF